jgi:hypothetical protein
MKYRLFYKSKSNISFQLALKESHSVFNIIRKNSAQISVVNRINGTSIQIEKIISPDLLKLGFTNQKTGLFQNNPVKQLRPDFYKKIGDSDGIILEVERGKTINNNMDLLDVWKCHLCSDVNYLILIVPITRINTKGINNTIFEYVVKRISTFFISSNYVNIDGCFIIGYD